ncbi:MAG TPA: elongation factor G [Acidimicrobiales bacterium]|nr:elongation factor G [Acidimicrobiales bacterium]
MKLYPPSKIRNVAVVGHGGSGKTTLVEALLHCSGATNRLGRVEDGSTVSDFEPEEVKRGISLSLALAPIEHDGHKINLIDTPGYADFVGDVHAALRVADLALFVVSAVEGVEVQTEVAWRMADELGVPRMVFVNKLDRERADFDRTLEQLKERFGQGVAPLELPIGTESAFRGIADLLTDTAYVYEGGKAMPGEIPDEMEAQEHQVHDALVEGIVVADDVLMERYLEGDVPSFRELEEVLAHGVAEASVFPVVCGAATTEIGIDRLASFICEIAPAPATDPNGEPAAFVFKTLADPYVGRINLFRVLSGSIKPDDHLVNLRTGTDERLHGLFSLRGKDQVDIPELQAGDIGAVAKLADVATGDVLAPKGSSVTADPIIPAAPVHSVAITPRTQADDDKLASSLHRLQEEDPALVVRRDDETHQTILSGAGDTHLQVALERLERKFGVHVDTEDVKVPYRETVSGTANAEGKYKKQSGGHGQFGVANITLEPLERGGGFEFVDAIVGGAIPRQFIPAVEKGIVETMDRGGHYGFPVVDVRVTLKDGKFHSVDSSEMSFKAAGSLAFKEALAAAGPCLLEPVSLLKVRVPETLQGDVMGDLNARRGRVQGTEVVGNHEQEVTAFVPTSELLRYSVDLRSMTGGRGSFTAEFDHYDVVPSHLVDKLATSAKSE